MGMIQWALMKSDVSERPEPPTRSRARMARERILEQIREAAITEFSLHGFKGASTQAIAERAGLTKPQLHYYIKGKDELYEELLFSVLHGWSEAFAFEIGRASCRERV